jgi:hypothetical protein
MIERAGFAQALVTPPVTGPDRANRLEISSDVSLGFWGAGPTPPSPQTAPPSGAPQTTAPSTEQKQEADKAEADAQKAFLKFRAAADALPAKLAAIGSRNQVAIAAARKEVEDLKKIAVKTAQENLKQQQLIPANSQKLPDARRLLRQALETSQGVAETRTDLASAKLSKLLQVEQELKKRLKDQPNKPLTEKEERAILDFIRETRNVVSANVGDWIGAESATSSTSPEPYREPDLCERGLADAKHTKELTYRIADRVELLVDRAAKQQPKKP